jgi:hypothetical protein
LEYNKAIERECGSNIEIKAAVVVRVAIIIIIVIIVE